MGVEGGGGEGEAIKSRYREIRWSDINDSSSDKFSISGGFLFFLLQRKCNSLKEHLHDNPLHSSGGVSIILEAC